jgi:hypothetical protein
MAVTVLATIAVRLQREGRLAGAPRAGHGDAAGVRSLAPPERPPLAGLDVA